jgi:hypothetical protein
MDSVLKTTGLDDLQGDDAASSFSVQPPVPLALLPTSISDSCSVASVSIAVAQARVSYK